MGKAKRRVWSMRSDRELMALTKANGLEVIADQMQRSPAFILKRAARLGLFIKGRKQKRKIGDQRSIGPKTLPKKIVLTP
jgi:hypothetical protein